MAADAWRDGAVERGFSMALSRLGDRTEPDCVLVTARRPDGRLCGLLQLVPWGPDGLSLDLMRRARDAENGTTEFLVASLVDAVPGLGVDRVSLNFAVLRAALEHRHGNRGSCATQLPRVALAALEAEAFLVRVDRLRRLLHRT